MSAICGLMLPVVIELPKYCEAPFPLAETGPLSSPIAIACGAAAAEAPMTEAAIAA